MRRRALWSLALAVALVCSGCATRHPVHEQALRVYMATDCTYRALPCGAARVDALYVFARRISRSDRAALELLGDLAVREGAHLRHPFNTGLLSSGPLADADRTGHFFAGALWTTEDYDRAIPTAESNAFWWEVLGELKSWVSSGAGFDYLDLWAHELGCEFARRVKAAKGELILPSAVLTEAERFRPRELQAGAQSPAAPHP